MRKFSKINKLRTCDADARAAKIVELITKFHTSSDSFIRNSDQAAKLILQIVPPTEPRYSLHDFNFSRSVQIESEKN